MIIREALSRLDSKPAGELVAFHQEDYRAFLLAIQAEHDAGLSRIRDALEQAIECGDDGGMVFEAYRFAGGRKNLEETP